MEQTACACLIVSLCYEEMKCAIGNGNGNQRKSSWWRRQWRRRWWWLKKMRRGSASEKYTRNGERSRETKREVSKEFPSKSFDFESSCFGRGQLLRSPLFCYCSLRLWVSECERQILRIILNVNVIYWQKVVVGRAIDADFPVLTILRLAKGICCVCSARHHKQTNSYNDRWGSMTNLQPLIREQNENIRSSRRKMSGCFCYTIKCSKAVSS